VPASTSASSDDDGASGAGAQGGAVAAFDVLSFVGSYGSRHPGGANFACGDGSVKFIKNSIAISTFRWLSNRADGEIISSDKF
jgi:prepilin-type processing-associated H-X9-DG protein